MDSALGDDRLAALRAAKLAALIAGVSATDRSERPAAGAPVDGSFPNGATRIVDGLGWVLDEEPGLRSLGPALTWALHRDVTALRLVVAAGPEVAGHLARRAGYFAIDVEVWRISATTMMRQEPTDLREAATWDTGRAASLVELVAAAGLDVIEEDGVIKGEFAGLEVARIVDGDPDPVLEVGIGRFDREIASMMHAGEPRAATLKRAVDLVARYRYRHAPPHPLRDLMVSRWVRRDVMAEPALVGAIHLEAIPSTIPVENLRDPAPAAAAGSLVDGGEVVVVCCGESDLDLVPAAADIVAVRRPGAALVLAVADRHLTPSLRRAAAALRTPPRLVAVDSPF